MEGLGGKRTKKLESGAHDSQRFSRLRYLAPLTLITESMLNHFRACEDGEHIERLGRSTNLIHPSTFFGTEALTHQRNVGRRIDSIGQY